MKQADLLRLYLRDRDRKEFKDDEIVELLNQTASVQEAAGLGWLLIAARASGSRPSSRTWGDVSETYAGSSESAAIAVRMSQYWFGKAGIGTARMFQVKYDGGVIGDISAVLDRLVAGDDYDLSRLIP